MVVRYNLVFLQVQFIFDISVTPSSVWLVSFAESSEKYKQLSAGTI